MEGAKQRHPAGGPPGRKWLGEKLSIPGGRCLKKQTARQDLYTRRLDYFMTVAGGLGAKMTQTGAPTAAD